MTLTLPVSIGLVILAVLALIAVFPLVSRSRAERPASVEEPSTGRHYEDTVEIVPASYLLPSVQRRELTEADTEIIEVPK